MTQSERNRAAITNFWKDVRAGIKPFPNRGYLVLELEERFWKKVKKSEPDACWEWTAGVDTAGYGTIAEGKRGGRTLRASRVSYEIHFGSIPDGLFVCHQCDNPKCVNPNHLKLGTPLSNMTDRSQRNRAPKGSALPQSKLTEEQAREIKRSKGSIRFSASSSTVSQILSGKQWKHVTA